MFTRIRKTVAQAGSVAESTWLYKAAHWTVRFYHSAILELHIVFLASLFAVTGVAIGYLVGVTSGYTRWYEFLWAAVGLALLAAIKADGFVGQKAKTRLRTAAWWFVHAWVRRHLNLPFIRLEWCLSVLAIWVLWGLMVGRVLGLPIEEAEQVALCTTLVAIRMIVAIIRYQKSE